MKKDSNELLVKEKLLMTQEHVESNGKLLALEEEELQRANKIEIKIVEILLHKKVVCYRKIEQLHKDTDRSWRKAGVFHRKIMNKNVLATLHSTC